MAVMNSESPNSFNSGIERTTAFRQSVDFKNLFGAVHISFFAIVHHGCPGSGKQSARFTAIEARGNINAPRPIYLTIILIASEVFVGE